MAKFNSKNTTGGTGIKMTKSIPTVYDKEIKFRDFVYISTPNAFHKEGAYHIIIQYPPKDSMMQQFNKLRRICDF